MRAKLCNRGFFLPEAPSFGSLLDADNFTESVPHLSFRQIDWREQALLVPTLNGLDRGRPAIGDLPSREQSLGNLLNLLWGQALKPLNLLRGWRLNYFHHALIRAQSS
jgi:hypothetical protein